MFKAKMLSGVVLDVGGERYGDQPAGIFFGMPYGTSASAIGAERLCAIGHLLEWDSPAIYEAEYWSEPPEA